MPRITPRLALVCASVGLLFLSGCVLPDDPLVADHSAYWFRHTDPARFFAHEQAHGRVYFVGAFDPALGEDSPVPGISRDDPAFRLARTWFVPQSPDLNARRSRLFDASAREFARRYNPLVLAYLKGHPEAK